MCIRDRSAGEDIVEIADEFSVRYDGTVTRGMWNDNGPTTWQGGYEVAFVCQLAAPAPTSGSTTGRFVGVAQTLSWTDARDYCRRNFYDLASIHSDQDSAEAVAACRNIDACGGACTNSPGRAGTWCWIGFHDSTSENSFEWSDGSYVTVSYTHLTLPTILLV